MPGKDTIQFAKTVQYVCKPFPVLEGNGVPVSLKLAQDYAGKTGYVFTNPDLTEAKINIFNFIKYKEQTLQHPFWNTWYTTLTEEGQVGENVIVFHGGYAFNNPNRVNKALEEGLIQGAGRLTETKILKEAMKKGMVPDTNIQVLPYTDFSELSQLQIQQLSRPYGVSLTLEEAAKLQSGTHKLKQLEDSPLFLTRAGGNHRAKEYLEVLCQLGAERYGNHFNFQENTWRLVFSLIYFNFGFCGYFSLNYGARFLGVNIAEGGAENFSQSSLDVRLETLNQA